MRNLLFTLLMVIGLNTTVFGFATILTSVKGGDEIVFSTNIADAEVFLDGQLVGKTFNSTFKYKLDRNGKPRVFLFKKEGYQEYTVGVNTQFDTAFWGNFLIGGPIGSSIDSWFTNNSLEYSPNQFYVELIPSTKSSAAVEATTVIETETASELEDDAVEETVTLAEEELESVVIATKNNTEAVKEVSSNANTAPSEVEPLEDIIQ